jgi:hypothetical protein
MIKRMIKTSMKILNPLPFASKKENPLNLHTKKSRAIPAAFRRERSSNSINFGKFFDIFMGIHHYLGQLGFYRRFVFIYFGYSAGFLFIGF